MDNLTLLNQMLDMWSSDGAVIFNRSVDTLPLSSGVQNYTMGPGGDINTIRPVGITQATITLGKVVTPMNIFAQNAYSGLSLPTLQGGQPYNLYVNNTTPTLQLQLYPVPSGGMTLTLYSMKPLNPVTLDTVLDLPPGYLMALVYNLAVLSAPQYEREASTTVKNTAASSLSTIKSNNRQYYQPLMAVDNALDIAYTENGNQWGYNIFGGY